MPDIDMQEVDSETEDNSQPPPSISISIEISPSGYFVNGEPLPDLISVLKTIVALDKAHPMASDSLSQLESGYHSA